MQTVDLLVQRGKVAVIDHHIVGMAQPLFAGQLRIENGLHLLRAGVVPLQRTFHLQRLRRIDHQHALGLAILARLDQQG
ncbi:hypothetical protein D3C80_1837700 [compost metagenome]